MHFKLVIIKYSHGAYGPSWLSQYYFVYFPRSYSPGASSLSSKNCEFLWEMVCLSFEIQETETSLSRKKYILIYVSRFFLFCTLIPPPF